MVKEVIRAPKFIREVDSLDKSYIERVQKLILKIINNPEIGKPMRNVRKGTREVYLPPFRLSYAYDKSNDIIVLLDIYHKDNQ